MGKTKMDNEFDCVALGRGFSQFSNLPPGQQRLPDALIDGELLFDVAVWGDGLGEAPEKVPRVSKVPSLGALWMEPRKFTDVIITTDTGTRFECHRSVLSLRSSVFDRMLHTACQETADANIRIPGFDDFVLRAMLEFMYTGKLPSLVEIGKYSLAKPRACVFNAFDTLTYEDEKTLKKGDVVNVLEVKDFAREDCVRGRVSDPAGWVSLGRLSDGFLFFIPEKKSDTLLSLSQLADMYIIPDLIVACSSQLLKDMASHPSQENVRRVAVAMKKTT